ncbi:glycosyltransferase [Promicromonospora iranensis]|uniref:Glycosyltransferase involved in cell wall biosynthesis n=1 Tax=Promicromonospora iranensis TaxID=1105144 RepID=A0ABU2CM90_9MICO|nr:glycosyltransferase [Promicromonospora iranensis]MDR7382455.1 glycosyltransferase involved in cell wall biosynthesis [Promicromonospora iranensis]
MTSEATPLRVLQSFQAPRARSNPYVVMLHDGLAATPGVTVERFSWRAALTGHHEVFHAHWPEALVEQRGRLSTLGRRLLAVVFLLRLRLHGTAIVRTVHNLHLPEGISWFERAWLRWLDRWTDYRITLTGRTPVDGPSSVVPHGDYRDWYARFGVQDAQPGHVAYVGTVRRYKSVDRLLDAFRDTDDAGLRLTVAGQPSRDGLADVAHAHAGDDPRIVLELRFVPDEEFVSLVTAAQVVCLPYRHMHNSGSVLAALSLDRHVLVPDNDTNRDLAREVGEEWFTLFPEQLTAADILEALRRAAAVPAGRRPDLSRRTWELGVAGHVAAYRAAVAARATRAHPRDAARVGGVERAEA